MSFGRILYRTATRAAEPLLGLWLHRRARSGKEVPGRLAERFARAGVDVTPARLVWMHGASIGETRILLEVAKELVSRDPGLHILMTSQTVTSAELIERFLAAEPAMKEVTRHQFAPADTPAIAERFMDQWQPCLCVFAEGEIWPNLIQAAHRRGIPLALINARMTRKSIDGWKSWSGFSREIFSSFDLILAADRQTASGLTELAGRDVVSPGNLKSALAPPGADKAALNELEGSFVGGRDCLVAVSTHPGEEAWVLDAASGIEPRPAIILVPRHPERREDIIALLNERSLSYSVRSRDETPQPTDDVLLADTLGEVGLFAALADTVYLGGGHAGNVGGHNPIEILRLHRPVVTGPLTFNFADMMSDLEGDPGFRTVHSHGDLIAAFPLSQPSAALIERLEDRAAEPMAVTLDGLQALLGRAAP